MVNCLILAWMNGAINTNMDRSSKYIVKKKKEVIDQYDLC